MSLQPHELELSRREQDEINYNLALEAFEPDAIDRIVDCLKNKEDLIDLLNTLDLEYDRYESLPNDVISRMIINAARRIV